VRRAHLEEVVDEVGVEVEIVLDGLVVDVHSGALHGDVLEAHVLPRDRVVRHHHLQRVVKLVILFVQERELAPQHLAVRDADEARNVDARAEQLEVLHELGGLVVGVHLPQGGEDAHVCALEPDATLQQRDELLKVPARHVVLAHLHRRACERL
jgi:hypothetical protein